MYTIDNFTSKEIIIKNSRFICVLYKVNDIESINKYILDIKSIYKDATHYCWAYILDGNKRSSDDGEPSGTAGIPILQVLEKNNLNYILCIVIRYFGGIKLGAGGLVRAYTKSVVNCLDIVNLKELVLGYDIVIKFNYDKVKQIDYILKDEEIINKDFLDLVIYRVLVKKDILDKLKLIDGVNISINNSCYI